MMDECLAARGGLEGGDGIPELTSGTPLGPGNPRSGVVEALKARSRRVYGIAAGANVCAGRSIGVDATITTTKTTTGS